MNRFILIRGIGFLFKDDFRMMIKEILIIEADMPYNAQAVGDDAEFIGIAEMAVNVELPESVKLIVFICQSTIRLAKSRKCTLIMLNKPVLM